MSLKFTNIQHEFRKANKLSLNEYVLCDMIFYLSSITEGKVPGWCYMTKQNMADEMGLSKQSIMNLLSKLLDKGFIIKQDVTFFLKTSAKWQKAYFTDGKESLPSHTKNFNQHGKESLLNNNIDNNTNNKEKNETVFSETLFPSDDSIKDKKKKIKKVPLVQLEFYEMTKTLVKMFPESITKRLSETQKRNWIDDVRKLIEIDLYSEADLKRIISAGLNDKFWKKNFHSITKLRKKNGDGITYAQLFSTFSGPSDFGGGNFVERKTTINDLIE